MCNEAWSYLRMKFPTSNDTTDTFSVIDMPTFSSSVSEILLHNLSRSSAMAPHSTLTFPSPLRSNQETYGDLERKP